MMQFHIVQLGRYSSAITHYTGAQTTNTRHTRKKTQTRESGNCPLYKPWSGWGVGCASGIRAAEQRPKSVGAGTGLTVTSV